MTPYNPLDKKNLGASVAKELLFRQVNQLPPERFKGAGVYCIYYAGLHKPFQPYKRIATHNIEPELTQPIYVGKAVPLGARTGGVGLGADPGYVLYNRLSEHAESIKQSSNLDIRDFHCRYLTVDDIWIPLAESVLIEMFSPIWNTTISGFGNHDPGSGRYSQKRSAWDVLHKGRNWADRLAVHDRTEEDLLKQIELAFAKQDSKANS